MFGFHSISQAPISSLAGQVRLGQVDIQSNGTVTSDVSVVASIQSSTQSLATASSNATLVLSGKNNSSSSAITSNNGTLLLSGKDSLSGSAITSNNGTLSISGKNGISGDAEVDSYGTLLSRGATLLIDSGYVTANGRLSLSGKSPLNNTGQLSGNQKIFRSVLSSLSGVASVDSDVHTIVGIGSNCDSTGSLIPNGTLSLSGKILTRAISNITGYGTRDTAGKVAIGPFNDIAFFTRKLSYVPALPRLKNNDSIFVDFPLNDGAGTAKNTSPHNIAGNTGGLSWGRVDGRMSLTSDGSQYSGNRISFDTTGMSLDRSSLFISFKPTAFNTYNFLFTLRGTGNNNNEIDIYYRTNAMVYAVVYDGTTSQTVTVSGVNLNEWNTLVVTWGDGLHASLNGGSTVSLSSMTPPSVLGSTAYVGGRTEDNFNMTGSIGHFRFYNKQIGQQETLQLHKNINQGYGFGDLVVQHDKMSSLVSNGILLGELDIVSLLAYINRSDGYNIDVSKSFIKSCNVSRLKNIAASIDRFKVNNINIDRILDKALEK